MPAGGGGLTLQISEVPAKIVLDQFLLDAKIKAVGVLDINLNNEDYDYVNVLDGVATPWSQANPLKPIGFTEGVLRIEDMLLIYPLDPAVQTRISLMPHSERGIFYMSSFIIQANLYMGEGTALLAAIDSMTKRFLAATEVSLFPMFPTSTALPETMPIALLNSAKIYNYHGVED